MQASNIILPKEQTPDGRTALVDPSLLIPIFKWMDTGKGKRGQN
ncbi:MAG: hypothetical protein ABSG68_05670 [Thermoguttaceae bacterium]|jgi:hypothetical protein